MKLSFKKSKFSIGTLLYCLIVGLFNNTECLAANKPQPIMTPYTLIGTTPEVGTYDSAPAYTIRQSEFFPDGTILYKQEYNNITYYSPKPPDNSEEAKTVSANYVDWGFWSFPKNYEKNEAVDSTTIFKTNEYYSQVKVNSGGAYAYGCDSKGSVLTTGKYLPEGTVLNVKSITWNLIGKTYVEFIYFDTAGTGVYSFNGVGRIESKYTTRLSDDVKYVYFNEVRDRRPENFCSNYYDNLKPYKTNPNRYWGSAHDRLELSTNVIPSNNVTRACNLNGKAGEWKYLGVSSKGNVVVNPYYPGDLVSFMGNGTLAYYDWRKTPWTSDDAEPQERQGQSNRLANLKNDAEKFNEEYGTPTTFDGPEYRAKKVEYLQAIINEGIKPVNGGATSELNAEQWADRVSLLTNPYSETPIFVGQRRLGLYSQPFSYVSKPTNDIYLSDIIVKRYDGMIIAHGTRSGYNAPFTYSIIENLKRGGCYTVEVKVGKKTNEPIKANLLTADLLLYSSYNDYEPFAYHKMGLANKGNLVSGNNISDSMYYHFTIDENFQGNFYRFESFIAGHHTGLDNLDYSNDSGSMYVSVIGDETFETGDIEPVAIQLVSQNTVVYDSREPHMKRAIIPGQSYDIIYTAQYTGVSLYHKRFDYGVLKWVDDISRPFSTQIPLSYSLTRKVGASQGNDGLSRGVYLVDSYGNQTVTMMSGTLLTCTIPNVMFEHPYLYASFNITCEDEKYNKFRYNDSVNIEINDGFDIVISNVRVLANKEYTFGPTTNKTFNVVYDATLVTPAYVNSSNYNTLVNTSININGTQKTFVDLLKPNTVTKDISHSISVSVGPDASAYFCEVIANYDRKVYENGGYDNNRGYDYVYFEKVRKPSLGSVNDFADNINNNPSLYPDRGGDANNNCLIPRRWNSYFSTHSIYNWNKNTISYPSLSGANTIHFDRYNILSESSITKSNSEGLMISDILFRSKYTKEKKLGADKDGWVSLYWSSDALVKAGYGFELKVIVIYRTNALLNNPEEKNNGNSGTFVTGLTGDINLIPEVFVELPGDKRTILSVNSYQGTTAGLSVKQIKNNQIEQTVDMGVAYVSEWEYTVKGTSSSGAQSVGRIFVPSNLKDGGYKLSVYTPPFTGVSNINKTKLGYTGLCDRKDMFVKVEGSATDDLNSHIIQ